MPSLIDNILFGSWCQDVYVDYPTATCSPMLPPMIIFIPVIAFSVGLLLYRMYFSKDNITKNMDGKGK